MFQRLRIGLIVFAVCTGCAEQSGDAVTAIRLADGVLAFVADSATVEPGASTSLGITVTKAPSDSVYWTYRDTARATFRGRVIAITSADGAVQFRDSSAATPALIGFQADGKFYVPLAVGAPGNIPIFAIRSDGKALDSGMYSATVELFIVGVTDPSYQRGSSTARAVEIPVRIRVR